MRNAVARRESIVEAASVSSRPGSILARASRQALVPTDSRIVRPIPYLGAGHVLRGLIAASPQ